jgi:hypothetical protein
MPSSNDVWKIESGASRNSASELCSKWHGCVPLSRQAVLKQGSALPEAEKLISYLQVMNPTTLTRLAKKINSKGHATPRMSATSLHPLPQGFPLALHRKATSPCVLRTPLI